MEPTDNKQGEPRDKNTAPRHIGVDYTYEPCYPYGPGSNPIHLLRCLSFHTLGDDLGDTDTAQGEPHSISNN